MKITEKKKALKNMVKSFEVDIIERKDPLKQFFYTKPDVAKKLESILQKEGGMKAQVTLKITLKKKTVNLKKFLNIKMFISILKLLQF